MVEHTQIIKFNLYFLAFISWTIGDLFRKILPMAISLRLFPICFCNWFKFAGLTLCIVVNVEFFFRMRYQNLVFFLHVNIHYIKYHILKRLISNAYFGHLCKKLGDCSSVNLLLHLLFYSLCLHVCFLPVPRCFCYYCWVV
jgi:hypothetical protein